MPDLSCRQPDGGDRRLRVDGGSTADFPDDRPRAAKPLSVA